MFPRFIATEIVLPGIVEPDGLIVRRRELPDPDERIVTVALLASGVSEAENAMRRDRYRGRPDFPFVPGYDLVGHVMKVAAVEDEMLVGQRVAAVIGTGAWASFVELDARAILMVPADLDPAVIAAVLFDGLSAWQMLARARLSEGASVLVPDGDGRVGGLLIQMAISQGHHVVTTGCRSSLAWLARRGADPLDVSDPELPARLAERAPAGFAAVFANLSGQSSGQHLRQVGRGGILVGYGREGRRVRDGHGTGSRASARGRFAFWTLAPNRGRRAILFNFWAGKNLLPGRFYARLQDDLDAVLALVRSGELEVRIARRFPLEEAGRALAMADTGASRGKIIILGPPAA